MNLAKPPLFSIGGASIVITEVEGFYDEPHPFNSDQFRFVFSMKSGNKIKTGFFLRSQIVSWQRVIKKKFKIKSISELEYSIGTVYKDKD